jgi:hypothetical protein
MPGWEQAIMPIIGALIGGTGALASGGGFMGKKARNEPLSLYDPQQQASSDFLNKQGMQNANFAGIENLARKNFSEQTIPSLAERFTSMGAGAQRSSGFQNAIGRAGSDLESQLAALRGEFGLSQLGLGLRPHLENILHQRVPGFFEGAARGLEQTLPGMDMGSIFGGRKKPGNNFSSQLMSMFPKRMASMAPEGQLPTQQNAQMTDLNEPQRQQILKLLISLMGNQQGGKL